MSLINDALKKAQRQRAEPPAGAEPAPGSSGPRVEKRGQAMRTQSLILIVAGAAVLVIVSVVVTVYLLSRPSSSARPPAPAVAAKMPGATGEPPAPVIVLPVTAPPATVVENATPTPAVEKDSSAVSTPPTSAASPSPAAANAPAPTTVETSTAVDSPVAPRSSPPSAAPSLPSAALRPPSVPRTLSPPASAGRPDVRIQAFVDAIRVTGIRSSGADSKVLMNDRVYRVNDLVDRTLGVKLVKVESDKLSFTDANGLLYLKNF